MQAPVTPLAHRVASFNCPSCLVYSVQRWGNALRRGDGDGGVSPVAGVDFAVCAHCGKPSIWVDAKIIWPESSAAPHPNPDLDQDIQDDFNEARLIIGRSPRGACAILRLCLQKLCKQLGEPGKNINDDIKSLVLKGLNPGIQKALDVVRVIGNAAVHPGEIDLQDKPEYAVKLCEIINFVAGAMITQPKQIEALYADMPEKQRKAIERRDAP